MSEHESHPQQTPELQNDSRRVNTAVVAGAIAVGVAVTGWNALTLSTEPGESVSSQTLTATPTPLPEPMPRDLSVTEPRISSPSTIETPQEQPPVSESTSPLESIGSQEALAGRPNRIIIPKLGIDAFVDYSDVINEKPNDCGNYNNPCAGQADSFIFEPFDVGPVGRSKLAQLTLHTSYGGESDIGAGLVDNSQLDPYTHTGLEQGDTVEFSGFENGGRIVAEVIPFPENFSFGEQVPDSPARFVSKQEELPVAERTATGEFVQGVISAFEDDGKKYVLLGNSYAGTGENGFELGDGGRKYSAYVLAAVIDVEVVNTEEMSDNLSLPAPNLNDIENSAEDIIRGDLSKSLNI